MVFSPDLVETEVADRLVRELFDLVLAEAATQQLSKEQQEIIDLLRTLIEDTWRSLQQFDTNHSTHFPSDRLEVIDKEIKTYDRTKPTNIGMYLLCILAAEHIGFLIEAKAETLLTAIIDRLISVERANGFYYDWCFQSGVQMEIWPGDKEKKKLDFISSVDNAWLALSLLILKKAKPDLAGKIQGKILNKMKFETFFNTKTQEYWGGKWVGTGNTTNHTYSRKSVSEVRVIALIHAALEKNKAKKAKILQRLKDKDGNVPNKFAGGSLFELFMVRLFISEPEFDEVIRTLFEIHKRYGLMFLHGLIGISVGDNPKVDNNYDEAGVGGIYPSDTWITSHGLVLPFLIDPKLALKTLLTVCNIAGYRGKYGLFDGVDVETQTFTNTQVFINQAMVFLSLFLFVHDPNFFKKYTHQYFANP